jgi:hypothetical protein
MYARKSREQWKKELLGEEDYEDEDEDEDMDGWE